MQTHFAPETLADPAYAASEAILRRCVHCGFCSATCPTYVVDGNELDSPRGRIMLIQALLENEGAPAPEAVTHIDRCLSCLACSTHCPSGVDYGRLVDHARVEIEARHIRPFSERVMRTALNAVLPRPCLFRALITLARMTRPAARVLPGNLKRLMALVPASARVPAARVRVHPAIGKRVRRVALMPGCVQGVLAPEIDAATVRLLTRHGVEVISPEGAGCCGALSFHLGREGSARRFARANLDSLMGEISGEGLDAVVVNASGCGSMMKDYGTLFRTGDDSARARTVAAKVRDISEVLTEIGLKDARAPERMRIAYQSACALQHGQKIAEGPVRLLRQAGFVTVELDEAHLCCGSAGVYNILQPAMADTLRRRKIDRIAIAGVDAVASGNIGCMTHLGAAMPTPICHTVELLDWATGGPKPPALSRNAVTRT